MSAESDARMLAGIRQTASRRKGHAFPLLWTEIDLLLRIADERDQLSRDLCEEQQGRGRRPIGEVRS